MLGGMNSKLILGKEIVLIFIRELLFENGNESFFRLLLKASLRIVKDRTQSGGKANLIIFFSWVRVARPVAMIPPDSVAVAAAKWVWYSIAVALKLIRLCRCCLSVNESKSMYCTELLRC